MSTSVHPGDGTYRITSDGVQTGGQQMDMTVAGDTLRCVIGVFRYEDPPKIFRNEEDPDSAIEFTADERANIIINMKGHSGVVTSIPA